MMSEEITGGALAIAGVIIGGILSHINDYINKKRDKSERARHLAVRIIIYLEELIHECANCIFEEKLDSDDGPYRSFNTPTVPELPDVDWNSIDENLAFSILSIPNKAKFAKSSVYDLWQVADSDAAIEERDFHFIQMSIEAISIIEDLAQKYNFKSNQDLSNWPQKQLIIQAISFNKSSARKIQIPTRIHVNFNKMEEKA